MRCPFALWIGSPNYGYPQGTHGQNHPVAIVDHVMAGYLTGCDSWFSHTPPWSSAHFGIGKDGAIHQYVDTDDGPYANGALNKPSAAGLEIAEFGNPNVLTVSIEHEGWPGEEWPDAMYQASLRLKRWLVSNVTTGMWRLLGHCDFDSVDRRNCPGPTWPKERLIADLEETVPTPQEIAEWKSYTEGLLAELVFVHAVEAAMLPLAQRKDLLQASWRRGPAYPPLDLAAYRKGLAPLCDKLITAATALKARGN